LNRNDINRERQWDRSQAVCHRAGLKKEGVSRQPEWHYDHFLDMTVNSILMTEWKENPLPEVT